jgi:hypothetical protein
MSTGISLVVNSKGGKEMSETEHTVQRLLEMTDLRPRLKSINVAGNLCVEVPNPLARLNREDRMKLVKEMQHNLLEVAP